MGYKKTIHVEDQTLEKLLTRSDYIARLPELQELSERYDSEGCGSCGMRDGANRNILLEARLILVAMTDARRAVLKDILNAGRVVIPYKTSKGMVESVEF